MRPGMWQAAGRKIGLAVHHCAWRHSRSSIGSFSRIANGAYLESDKHLGKANEVVELRKSVTAGHPVEAQE